MGNPIKFIGRVFYRVWFYVVAGIPLIVLSPFLVVLSLFSSGYPLLYWIARNLWTPVVLFGMGTPIKIQYDFKPLDNTPYVICANHCSMLDLFCILRLSKRPVLFVGKKELRQIPLFGFIYKNVSVLVNRSSKESRTKVYQTVKEKLKASYSLCIFPEGMVPDESVLIAPFKDGAFKIAIEQGAAVLPVTLYNTKCIFPYSFKMGGPGTVHFRVHQPVATRDMKYDQFPELRDTIYDLLKTDLLLGQPCIPLMTEA